MEKIDLLIENVMVFNSYFKQFVLANVTVSDGRIFCIDRERTLAFAAAKTVDGTGKWLVPGLVDIHMHIESSMMTPQPFCRRLAACGVTTIVSEPHEMANVRGIDGIRRMIEAGRNAVIDVYYGIPSSVPSTSEALETTGAAIDFAAMKELLDWENIICVGEIMNYRQVIRDNDLEITKFLAYLRRHKPRYIVEGHCPALQGLDLAKFLYLGIDGDHTEHTLAEFKQRFENGMYVEIQEKTLRPELLAYIAEQRLYEHFGFVTDDKMADDLYENGHLDTLVRKAIRLGMRPEDAIYGATYTNARRMRLTDRGALAPGKLADFVLLDQVADFTVAATYKNGNLIYQQGDSAADDAADYRFPREFYHSVQVKPLERRDFVIPVGGNQATALVNVIEVQAKTTRTQRRQLSIPVKAGQLCWQESGCLLAMVIERYGKNGNIGYGLVTGDCIKRGAVATTYFHDHHNLFLLGGDVASMLAAGNRVIAMQGGIATAERGVATAELALPIGGILSDCGVAEIGLALKAIRRQLVNLGYAHQNPIMSLCTLGLPVSPALKLTDKGLVNVIEGKIEPLIVVE